MNWNNASVNGIASSSIILGMRWSNNKAAFTLYGELRRRIVADSDTAIRRRCVNVKFLKAFISKEMM